MFAALGAYALLLCLPIWQGGWLTYLDNPAHVAEIRSLAAEGWGGWSPFAFAGLSLDALHSPVIWRGLALLTRWGVPLGWTYPLCVTLGVAAPAWAMFTVARRQRSAEWALVVAWLVLIQRPSLVGTASATGGMWAFHLGIGGLILLSDRLTRPRSEGPQTAVIALLLGAIGLTHLFVLVAAALMVAVALVLRQVPWRVVLGAGALGAAMASPYVIPVLAASGASFRPPQNLAWDQLAQLLVLPTDVIDLVTHSPWFSAESAVPWSLESVPMVALLAWGVVGAWRARTQGPRIAQLGAILAVVVIALLLLAHPLRLTFLGPVSWRFLAVVRVAAALAAAGALPVGVASAPATAKWRAASAVAVVASAWLWGAPLNREAPRTQDHEMKDVSALWTWLHAHPQPRGRVYLQDTFMTPPYGEALVRSHVLTLTYAEAGVEALGPMYGIIPSATANHTVSELGQLFGAPVSLLAHDPDRLRRQMQTFDVTRLVTASPRAEAAVTATGLLTPVTRIGRFAVSDGPSTWPQLPGDPMPPVRADTLSPQVLEATVSPDNEGTATLSHAFHPFWRVVRGPPGTTLEPSRHGLITLRLPPGTHAVSLRYEPPAGLWWVSLLGLAGALALWKRSRAPVSGSVPSAVG